MASSNQALVLARLRGVFRYLRSDELALLSGAFLSCISKEIGALPAQSKPIFQCLKDLLLTIHAFAHDTSLLRALSTLDDPVAHDTVGACVTSLTASRDSVRETLALLQSPSCRVLADSQVKELWRIFSVVMLLPERLKRVMDENSPGRSMYIAGEVAFPTMPYSSSASGYLIILVREEILALVGQTRRDLLDSPREFARQALWDLLAPAVAGLSSIEAYGSCVNTFAGPDSDVDMTLTVALANVDAASVLRIVKKAIELQQPSRFSVKEFIDKATVPVLALKTLLTGVDKPVFVDVTVNNHLPVWNSKLLRAYSSIDSSVRELVLAVKAWAKAREICDAAEGTLSAYGWCLLAIFFLQRRSSATFHLPVLQAEKALTAQAARRGVARTRTMIGSVDVTFCDDAAYARSLCGLTDDCRGNVGELFCEFVTWLHHGLPVRSTVVSVRTGSYLNRDFWAQQAADRDGKLQDNVRFPSKYAMPSWRLAIEDPFKRSLISPPSLSGQWAIEVEIRRAAQVIETAGASLPFEPSAEQQVTSRSILRQLWVPVAPAERQQRSALYRRHGLFFLEPPSSCVSTVILDTIKERHRALEEAVRHADKHVRNELDCLARKSPVDAMQAYRLQELRAAIATVPEA